MFKLNKTGINRNSKRSAGKITGSVLSVMLLLLVGIKANGQNQINTDQVNRVYSRYGVGVISPELNHRNRAMGGTGIASPSKYSINWANPSLLHYNDAVSFEFNVEGDLRSAEDWNGNIYQDNETSITSIRFAIPIYRNRWQTSFGIRPFSKINYSSFATEMVGPAADSMYNYNIAFGQGAINQISWKNGVRVIKNFNLGLDVSYYFGNVFGNNISFIRSTLTDNKIASDIQGNAYVVDVGSQMSQQVEYLNYNGFSSTLGASWFKKLDSIPFDIFLGATYDLSTNMNSRLETHKIMPWQLIDTTNTTGSHSIPSGLALGAALVVKDTFDVQRYMLAMDFASKKYNNVQNNRYAFGVEKMPNPDKTKGLGRNIYRLGGYFSQNALLFKTEGVDEFGITFGIGIPARRGYIGTRSIFDFGITAGQHGTTTNGGIKESFIRLNIGLTFNDRWFQQIRID